MNKKAVTIIGISDNGCVGLNSRAVNSVVQSQVLAGGERHHEFFPQFDGHRVYFKEGLLKAVDEVIELAEENSVAVLASGDPMFHGIGSLLIKKLGAENVEVQPQPSSIQLAFASIGKKWDDATLLSFHGKKLQGLTTQLRSVSKAGILTDDKNTPAVIAKHMLEYSQTGWDAWVCENLSGPDEKVTYFGSLEELSKAENISPLNVLVLERKDENWRAPSVLQNLHEDEFAKRMPQKGLITKKEVRVMSLGEMRVQSDDVVWDVGASSGSVVIEAMAFAPKGHGYAIEVHPESIEYCKENLRTMGIDNVTVIHGKAPNSFSLIDEDPDVVFVGGSKGKLKEIINQAHARLKPGGRIVVNAVTFENVAVAYETFREMGYEPNIIMMNVSRAVPIAGLMRYDSQNAIHIFSITKE